jgi:hypothetical protein
MDDGMEDIGGIVKVTDIRTDIELGVGAFAGV